MSYLRLTVFGTGWSPSGSKAVCDGDDFTVYAVVDEAVPNAATPNIYQGISPIAARRWRDVRDGGRRSSQWLGRTDRGSIREERRVLEIHPFVPSGYSKRSRSRLTAVSVRVGSLGPAVA